MLEHWLRPQPNRSPPHDRHSGRQTKKRPKWNHIVAPRNELNNANHECREWRNEKKNETRLPAEERSDHHHQRHVAEAHRLASQRKRTNEPYGPDNTATAY